MAPDRLRSVAGLCTASLAVAASLPPTASADNPSWNGQYAITFMVGPKDGTSVAASQPESQHTETYFDSDQCQASVLPEVHDQLAAFVAGGLLGEVLDPGHGVFTGAES